MQCKKGYKSVDGKCKKRFFSGNKKSYNPFKMWGSWVGAILLMSIQFYHDFGISLMYSHTLNITTYIKTILMGFIFGWIINSLWRKFKK